jgi:DNA-binding MarR family transcriptional regulator/GNAT superfamily N-acetyltransferase
MGQPAGARIEAVRAFNRFWTQRIGVLGAGLLETPYSLTEARLLFELGRAASLEVADLRRVLGLDSGYLSRILGRFRRDGLVVTEASASDARRQVVRLTDAGREVYATLDARSAAEIGELLGGLDDAAQRELVVAMETIRRTLEARAVPAAYVLRDLEPGDLGWVLQRHGALYAAEHGWDASFEALVARIVADFAEAHDPVRERGWIAELDGRPVGSILCVRLDDETAQLRVLLVEPEARGLGVGGRLVDECIRFARRQGYRRLRLWTNGALAAARRQYERAGFALVSDEPTHQFGREQRSQVWELEL